MDDTKYILIKTFLLIGRDAVLPVVSAKYDVVQNLAIACHRYNFIGEPHSGFSCFRRLLPPVEPSNLAVSWFYWGLFTGNSCGVSCFYLIVSKELSILLSLTQLKMIMNIVLSQNHDCIIWFNV